MNEPDDKAAELARIKRSFVIGLVLVVVLMAGALVLLRVLNGGRHRPEGAAERWLTAVADTTRKGVKADGRKRAEAIGPLSLARSLIPARTDGHRAFADLEVGKASTTSGLARVPFRLHAYAASGSAPTRTGAIVLVPVGGRWHVARLEERRPGEKVPSEGGSPPSRVGPAAWLFALLLGLGVTVGVSALVEWTSRSSGRAMAAGAGAAAGTATG